jgi:Ankyrin repeats (3 copies)/Ankyrin repeat
MPARSLPPNPSLENLRKQAKTLQHAARSGDDAAIELVREFHPYRAGGLTGFTLANAQLVIARSYGFRSWRRLREHLAVIGRYARSPHRQPVGGSGEPAEQFLRLACLTYGVTDGADDTRRHARAREMLDAHPDLAGASIYTAAAVGDVVAARALLAADPARADRDGGPYRWPPLLYLAFSRVDSTRPGHSTLEVATLLLEHGADPNAGYLWDGESPPYTALTGAFGRGRDPANQPRHQYGVQLARLLLAAGADPNDARALLNCGGLPADDTHLEVLFAYGLGHGSGGPWRTRLGPAQPTPAMMVHNELLRAAWFPLPDRVRLLLDRGVEDINAQGQAFTSWHYIGRTAHDLAVLGGHTEVAEMLAAAGAQPTRLDPLDVLMAACMRADRPTIRRLLAEDATLAERIIAREPSLLELAAWQGRLESVRLLAEIGFDMNAAPGWASPLHRTAAVGHLDVVKLLIELGADPTARAVDFKPGDPDAAICDPTPLGWARHYEQHEVADYLAAHQGLIT